MRTATRIALVLVGMVVALEALLHLAPLPDPEEQTRGSARRPVHRFLPGWDVQGTWLGQTPPFSTTFVSGPIRGVSTDRVVFSANRYGFPYPESRMTRRSDDEVRIGVVGGSTVECAALEEGKRWPAVLERRLAEAMPGRPVTALNMGIGAQGTRTHLATVAQHAVKLDLDYLVFLLGANDLFRVDSADAMLRSDAFAPRGCRCLKPFLLRFQLVRRLHVLYHRLKGTEFYVNLHEPGKPYFADLIAERLSFPVLPTARLAISPRALDDYELNIVSLAGLAGAHGITPIFATQPMLWKPDMTAAEDSVDWLRGLAFDDGKTYRVPAAEQARALETLNRRLLETCARRGLKCIDVEKKVPRTLDYFYDSLHLTEAGAERVAQEVADYITGERN
jgi:lysophospholipase L1-like esterase